MRGQNVVQKRAAWCMIAASKTRKLISKVGEHAMARTEEELVEALMTQWRHMSASCNAYDAGDKSEAIRLATAIYTIVQDGGSSKSILSQLEQKETLQFVTTGHTHTEEEIKSAERYTPLIELDPAKIEFVPIYQFAWKRKIEHPMTKLPFDGWWEKDIIFFDGDKRLNRKQLTQTLRNQEGGGHYDNQVRNQNYAALKEKAVMVVPGDGGVAANYTEGLHWATMRQIAHELDLSLKQHAWPSSMKKGLIHRQK